MTPEPPETRSPDDGRVPSAPPGGHGGRRARPAPRVRHRPTLAPVLAGTVLAVALVGGCQKETPMTGPSDPSTSAGPSAASCAPQAGEVAVLRGGTFPVDAGATLRAGLQYEVKQDPRTWKVMFMGTGVSESHDLAAGDRVTVGGLEITVRAACEDRVVLGVGGGAGGASATTG